MLNVELRINVRVTPGGIVDRVLVGQQRVFKPLVMRAVRLAQRIAQLVQERRLIRCDDRDQISNVLGQFRQCRPCGIGCFACESHKIDSSR